MKIKHLSSLICVLFFSSLQMAAQDQLDPKSHYLLGVDVAGHEIALPFGKEEVKSSWDTYAKKLGRSEETQGHQAYEAVFSEALYADEILLFVEITGDAKAAKIWMGIDPQGIPKEIYPELSTAAGNYIYEFYIKMRKDAAQEKIDDSERAATYLSKSYEDLKKEARKSLKNQQKNQEKIEAYEQELKQMRQDSVMYKQTIEGLNVKLDSIYLEIEKVKKIVDMYRAKLEEIK